jgi:hypothetical protein
MAKRRHLDDELDWLAFRYVSRELTADEQAAFEARLARDVTACEAVAAAVELAGAVARASPGLAPSRPRRKPALKLLASGAAAALALAFGVRHALTPAERADFDEPALSVPLMWSGLRQAEPPAYLESFEPDDHVFSNGEVADDEAALASWLVEMAGLEEVEPEEEPDEPPAEE